MVQFGFTRPSQQNFGYINRSVLPKQHNHNTASRGPLSRFSQGSGRYGHQTMRQGEQDLHPSVVYHRSQRPPSANSSGRDSASGHHGQNDPFGEFSQLTQETEAYPFHPSRGSSHSSVTGEVPLPNSQSIPMRQPSTSSSAVSHPSRQQFSLQLHQDSQSSGDSSRRSILRPRSHGSSSSESSCKKRARFAGENHFLEPTLGIANENDRSSFQGRPVANRQLPLFSSHLPGNSASTGSNQRSNTKTTPIQGHLNKMLTKRSNPSAFPPPPNPARPSTFNTFQAPQQRSVLDQRYSSNYTGTDNRDAVPIDGSRSGRSSGFEQGSRPLPHDGFTAFGDEQTQHFIEKMNAVMDQKMDEYHRRLEEDSDRKKREFEKNFDEIGAAKLKAAEASTETALEMKLNEKTAAALDKIDNKASECEARIDGRTEGNLAKLCNKTLSCLGELDRKQKSVLATIQKQVESTVIQGIARIEDSATEPILKIHQAYQTQLNKLQSLFSSLPMPPKDPVCDRPSAIKTRRSKRVRAKAQQEFVSHGPPIADVNSVVTPPVPPDVSCKIRDNRYVEVDGVKAQVPLRRSKKKTQDSRASKLESTRNKSIPTSLPPPVAMITVDTSCGIVSSSNEEASASNVEASETNLSKKSSIVSPKQHVCTTTGTSEDDYKQTPPLTAESKKPRKTALKGISSGLVADSRSSDVSLFPNKKRKEKRVDEPEMTYSAPQSNTPTLASAKFPAVQSSVVSAKSSKASRTSAIAPKEASTPSTPKTPTLQSQSDTAASRRTLTTSFESSKTSPPSTVTSKTNSTFSTRFRRRRKRKECSPFNGYASESAAKRSKLDHHDVQTTLPNKTTGRKTRTLKPLNAKAAKGSSKSASKSKGSQGRRRGSERTPDWIETSKEIKICRNKTQTYSKRPIDIKERHDSLDFDG